MMYNLMYNSTSLMYNSSISLFVLRSYNLSSFKSSLRMVYTKGMCLYQQGCYFTLSFVVSVVAIKIKFET